MTVWIGIDPGARWTGVVARGPGDVLVGHRVVDRQDINPTAVRVSAEYLEAVGDAVLDLLTAAGPNTELAIEDVIGPVGYEFVRPTDLIGLGITLGWLMARFPFGVLVRPGKHGSRPLVTYPIELTTPLERAHATRAKTWARPAPRNSAIRHARSAWDVAGAGPVNQRLAAASAAAPAPASPAPKQRRVQRRRKT